MSTFVCKQCGGALPWVHGVSTVRCEFCDSVQTVPNTDSDEFISRFSTANDLWMRNQFESAAAMYTKLTVEYAEEAELYWRLVLCKYGIEYTDDDVTGKKIPIFHRVNPAKLGNDPEYQRACQYADADALDVYRRDAAFIDAMLQQYHEITVKEKPCDIFLCFNDVQPDGQPTRDVAIARETCDMLTDHGYKAFFSQQGHLAGTEWEPQVLAALSSAKVMLVFCTDPDYLFVNRVKNEWSRYLEINANDISVARKKLIPCFMDMDPAGFPKEFSQNQGQNMAFIGSQQLLLKNIESVLQPSEKDKSGARHADSETVESLLTRAQIALEDGEWERAVKNFSSVIDINPTDFTPYLGRSMARNEVSDRAEYENGVIHGEIKLSDDSDYWKAKKYADAETLSWLESMERQRGEYLKEKSQERLRIHEIEKREEEHLKRLQYAESNRCKVLIKRIENDFTTGKGNYSQFQKEINERNELEKKISGSDGDRLLSALGLILGAFMILLGIARSYVDSLSGFLAAISTLFMWLTIVFGTFLGFMIASLIGAGIAIVILILILVKFPVAAIVAGVVCFLASLLYFIRSRNDKSVASLPEKLSSMENKIKVNLLDRIAQELKASYLKEYRSVDPKVQDFDYMKTATKLRDSLLEKAFKPEQKNS